MCSSLTDQVWAFANVTIIIAKSDLTQKIEIEAKGEIFISKRTVETMVDQLGTSASEVTRVALELGTHIILGGLARSKSPGRIWPAM